MLFDHHLIIITIWELSPFEITKFPPAPWNYFNGGHVFNFEVEKIDQNELKLDIQNLFYTNLSTQNPMS